MNLYATEKIDEFIGSSCNGRKCVEMFFMFMLKSHTAVPSTFHWKSSHAAAVRRSCNSKSGELMGILLCKALKKIRCIAFLVDEGDKSNFHDLCLKVFK